MGDRDGEKYCTQLWAMPQNQRELKQLPIAAYVVQLDKNNAEKTCEKFRNGYVLSTTIDRDIDGVGNVVVQVFRGGVARGPPIQGKARGSTEGSKCLDTTGR